MPTTRVPYRDRIPIVKKIITEAKEPIGFTELHKRLIKETGVQISRHTLQKCLKTLYFENKITKRDEEGVGNPVKYSMNIESNDIPRESIKDADYINVEVSEIACQFYWLLFEYSCRSDRKKDEDYKDRIKLDLVPRMLEIRNHVTHPVIMSKEIIENLYKTFFVELRAKFISNSQRDTITKEEHE